MHAKVTLQPIQVKYPALCLHCPHCHWLVTLQAGVLRIMELPRNLRRPVSNERKLMSVFLEREVGVTEWKAYRRELGADSMCLCVKG